MTVTQAMQLEVPVTRTKRAKYTYEAKHLLYDVRNKHIAVEEEVPDPGAGAPLDDACSAHDRARKASHDI